MYQQDDDLTLIPEKYDYIVVGGGVAGIFTAEALSRSGKKILLVEKESKFATEASGEQHGLAQFGYLYIGMADPKVAEACLHNIELLLHFYALPGNNLISHDNELISSNPESLFNWFRTDPLYFYYPDLDDSVLNLSKLIDEKTAWQNSLYNIFARTQAITDHRWGGTTIQLSGDTPIIGKKLLFAKKIARHWMRKTAEHKPDGLLAKKLNKEVDAIAIHTDLVITSHDRPMYSTRILASVKNRYVLNGGHAIFKTQINKYNVKEDGTVELLTTDGLKYNAEKVIFTSGSGLSAVHGSQVKTVLSPLLVVSPPVCERNLVYLTPKVALTVNHIHHVDPVTGKAYSIIGNGLAIQPDDELAMENCRLMIIQQAERVFPKLKMIPSENRHIYFGHKTELVKNEGDRNYHFEFQPIDQDKKIWVAVPGKFTLAPSLAAYIYEQMELEKLPAAKPFDLNEMLQYHKLLLSNEQSIGDTLHSQLIGDRLGADDYPFDKRVARSKLRYCLFREQLQHHSGDQTNLELGCGFAATSGSS